jgi:hypothetical protein
MMLLFTFGEIPAGIPPFDFNDDQYGANLDAKALSIHLARKFRTVTRWVSVARRLACPPEHSEEREGSSAILLKKGGEVS